MEELKQIRKALEVSQRHYQENMAGADLPQDSPLLDKAFVALARLEAREAEITDAASIANDIFCDGFNAGRNIPHDHKGPMEYAAIIGQYAYRYSEDIRKERDAAIEALIRVADWSIDVSYPDDARKMREMALVALGLNPNEMTRRTAREAVMEIEKRKGVEI